MGIKTNYGLIIVKQISGILARKCFNFAGPGDQIQSGQRYGLIKFGSRVELFLPPDAKVLCSVGEKVKGGLTPIAEMKEEDIQNE
jgi:phosphatidylserine decarboxylase